MIRSDAGWMRWDGPNGPDLFVPPIITSANGWVYRPDEARTADQIRTGTNKAFPRSDGYSHAQDWFENYLSQEFSRRNWTPPDAIEKPVVNPYGASNSLTVAWKSRPWGWVTLTATIHDDQAPRWGNNGELSVYYLVQFHPAGEWFLHQSLDVNNARGKRSGSAVAATRKEAHKLIARFMEDPWREVASRLDSVSIRPSIDLYHLLLPPVEDLRNLSYPEDEIDYDDGREIVTRSHGAIKYWIKGTVEKAMSNDVNWEALNDLLGAFKHLGYKVAVKQSYGWENKRIEGIEVTIPKDPQGTTEAEKETDHKITLAKDGIKIWCGFEHEEVKWIERERRKAKEAMSLMEAELGETTEFTIDL